MQMILDGGARLLVARLLSLALLLVMFPAFDAEARRVEAAIAVDVATGEVLYSRSADRKAYPASLTKMMTLYLTFEAIRDRKLSFKTKLKVSKRAAGMPASKLGLRRGSTITVKSAVLALITKSANDAAVVLAEKLGGTEIGFGKLMTAKARELGMRKTSFRNASGLTNRHQRTTARDMAKLAMRLIKDFPRQYDLFSTRKFSWGKRTYRTTNKLLGKVRGVDGLKTGYTRASGFNLATSAVRNGHRIVAIVLGGRSSKARDKRMRQVLDRGFELRRGLSLAAVVKPVMKPVRRADPTIETVLAHLEDLQPVVASKPVAEAAVKPVSKTRITPVPASKPGFLDRPASAVVTAQTTAQGQDTVAQGQTMAGAQTGSITLVWNGKRAVVGVGGGPFSVQVGAYHDPQLAQQAAVRATRKLPAILGNGDIKISPLKGRKKPVYRARVQGFTKDVADRACVLLKQKNNDCLVVKTASS